MQLLPKKSLVALLALLTVGSAACVKQNDPGVGLVKFDSSAVFGITPPEKPVVPGFEVPEDVSAVETEIPDLVPRVLPKPPVSACPEAALTAFPKKSATVKVTDMPTAGLYKWKRNLLSFKNAANTPPVKSFPFGLENRAIRRVTRESDHQFSFEMVQPDPSNARSTLITGFRVNTNEQLIVDRRVDSRTIGVVMVPGRDVLVANPADAPGIFVTGIDVQSQGGDRVSTFSPVQPMLVLPLDGGLVRPGQTFRSVGIDGATGTAVVNDGVTGRTSRVDACGEVVEGYTVTLRQTLTSDIQSGGVFDAALGGASRELTYTFATQYGALPIGESFSIGDIERDSVAALGKWELGSLTPTALPDSLK